MTAQDIITAAGGGGTAGPLTVDSVPVSAGGGKPEEALLEHFVFHAPPRRQFLMPQLRSATDADQATSRVRFWPNTFAVDSQQHHID